MPSAKKAALNIAIPNGSTSKAATTKPPVSKAATSKVATTKATTTKATTTKATTTKATTTKATTTKATTTKATTTKATTTKAKTTNVSASKAATKVAAKAATTKATPAKATPAKATPAKATPAKATPAKATPAKVAPKKALTIEKTTPNVTTSKVNRLKPSTPKLAVIPEAFVGNTCESTQQFNPLDYMTASELDRVDQQLARSLRGVEVLVFWTGVDWSHAQRWARTWKLKTLTIAMGPLMDPTNPDSPKAKMPKKAYSLYVKGVSGRFADYARQHCRVVVLTNPPPNIYSSRENNTYQHLEEPILKGLFGGRPVRRIDYVHPTVTGAEHVTYQTWPCDKSKDWTAPFGVNQVRSWRKLNWSYKSLITTSQIGLRGLQKEILPVASTVGKKTLQAPSQSELVTMRSLAGSTHPSDLGAEDLNRVRLATEDGSTTKSEERVVRIKKCQLVPVVDVSSHDSKAFSLEEGPCEAAASHSSIGGLPKHDHLDQRVEVCEKEPTGEPGGLLVPVYAIKRCAKPVLPTVLPVVCINDIAAGEQVTLRVDEIHLERDFLYLTMQNKSGTENWWKASWS